MLLAASMSVFAMDQARVAADLPYFEFNSNMNKITIIIGITGNALFAGIDGSALTDDEMMMVEGDGVATAVAGAIIGGTLSGMYESFRTVYNMISNKENRSNKEIGVAILDAMLAGAITGFIGGAIATLP